MTKTSIKEIVWDIAAMHGGNMSATARAAKVSQNTIWRISMGRRSRITYKTAEGLSKASGGKYPLLQLLQIAGK